MVREKSRKNGSGKQTVSFSLSPSAISILEAYSKREKNKSVFLEHLLSDLKKSKVITPFQEDINVSISFPLGGFRSLIYFLVRVAIQLNFFDKKGTSLVNLVPLNEPIESDFSKNSIESFIFEILLMSISIVNSINYVFPDYDFGNHVTMVRQVAFRIIVSAFESIQQKQASTKHSNEEARINSKKESKGFDLGDLDSVVERLAAAFCSMSGDQGTALRLRIIEDLSWTQIERIHAIGNSSPTANSALEIKTALLELEKRYRELSEDENSLKNVKNYKSQDFDQIRKRLIESSRESAEEYLKLSMALHISRIGDFKKLEIAIFNARKNPKLFLLMETIDSLVIGNYLNDEEEAKLKAENIATTIRDRLDNYLKEKNNKLSSRLRFCSKNFEGMERTIIEFSNEHVGDTCLVMDDASKHLFIPKKMELMPEYD